MILNFCSTLLSQLLSSDYQTRQALRWWHQRQVNRLHGSAELIRDGILQELFALRRGLELIDGECNLPPESLRQLEALHLRLEEVSNELSPAFSRDSLPLAMQHILQVWQRRHPTVRLTTQLTSGNTLPPTLTSRVALTTLEEVLQLITGRLETDTTTGTDITMAIHLQQEDASGAIAIALSGLPRRHCNDIAQMEDLTHLRQAFEVLTGGSVTQVANDSTLRWQLSWPIFTPVT